MQTPLVYEISPGVTLTCVITEKFKTGCLSVSLITELSRHNAPLSALLMRVLRRGSVNHPDMQSISAKLDTLYGARIEPEIRKKGEMHCVGFYCDFVDDSCIPGGGDNILEKTAALMGEILLEPDLKDGLLRADYVEGERKLLIDDIRAVINDKRDYALARLLEEMCAEESFGVSRLGREEEAAAITPLSLTEHYRKLLAQSRIELFYCGPAEAERVKSAVQSALAALPERGELSVPETRVVFEPVTDEPRRFTQELDVAQGKLTVGFRMGDAMKDPDYPSFMVTNALYGGCVTSKLFLNVREKLSLCYYASSMLERHKGVMLVSSGVEFTNFDKALSEILAQLDCVKNGDFSEDELLSAKRAVVTAIKSAMDKPAGLADLYFDSTIAAKKYSPDELCGRVEAVTKENVVKTASGIKPDSIYFLTGKGAAANEA